MYEVSNHLLHILSNVSIFFSLICAGAGSLTSVAVLG